MPGHRIGDRDDTRPLAAMEAAAKFKRLALLGAPGGGKALYPAAPRAAGFRPTRRTQETATGVPCDSSPSSLRYATWRHASCDSSWRAFPKWSGAEILGSLVLELAGQNLAGLSRCLAPPAERCAESGRLVLVLDGLDEVPQGPHKAFRQAVAATLARFRPERVIVTCRVRSYQGDARLPQFEAHTLALHRAPDWPVRVDGY